MSLSDKLEGAPNPEQIARLRQIENDFGRAWQSGQIPEFATFLPSPGDPLRRAAIFCLLRIDLEERWRRNLFVLIEGYLDRFEELGKPQELPARLLADEYRLRHRFGDRPALATYERRFPSQFAELQRLLQGDDVPTLTPGPPTPAPLQPSKVPVTPHVLPISPEYRLIKKIGRGSYGEVWLAEGPGDFPVAMKIIYRPAGHEDVKRELQTIEVIKRLRHPFLLATTAYWQAADRLEIAMELAESDLHKRLQQCKDEKLTGIPVEELLGYFRDAAEAIDYLHKNSVLHRDIKPANLLLLEGHVKVADFGLVRNAPTDDLGTATFCGTPLYIAPEVWESKISPASDLYSLAVTYAELRLGHRLFAGRSLGEIELEHRATTPALDPLGPAEQRVLLKALSKRPEARHVSCKEFVAELAEVFRPPASRTQEMPDSAAFGQTLRAPEGWKPPPPESPATTHGSTQTGSITVPSPPSRSLPPGRPYLRAGLSVLAVGIILVLAWQIVAGRPGSFTLAAPEMVVVGQGKHGKVELTVRRSRLIKPVELAAAGLPAGVTLENRILAPEDGETVQLELRAARTAKPGRTWIELRGESGDAFNNTGFFLTVVPLPLNCEPLGEDTIDEESSGRLFYQKIAYQRVPGEPPFVFVAVPRGRSVKAEGDDPDTFYILRDKVSVAQFRRFADANKTELRSTGWNREYHPDCPALDVYGMDAYTFATSWIKGRLPTLAQWEKAAGKFAGDEREGPYEGKWGKELYGRIAVSAPGRPLTAPLKCGEASADESIYGCRDMAGNGMEWTRITIEEKQITDSTLKDAIEVQTRGSSYLMPVPYRFKHEAIVANENFRREPREKVGFRVVLESDSWAH